MARAPTVDEVGMARAAAERPLAAAHRATVGRLSAADWSAGGVEEGGQFHRVLVLPGVGAVRMTRTAQAAGRLRARMALVQALATTAALPVALPVPLTEVAGPRDGRAAVVQDYLPGRAHPPHSGDPRMLRVLCTCLAAVDTTALEPYLGPPFAFRGPWTVGKVRAVQDLPTRLRTVYGAGLWPDDLPATAPRVFARTVEHLTGTVTAWTADPVVPPSLVHGDLAGHNMRWIRTDDVTPGTAGLPADTGWTLTGLLDWDLACRWDPALNPAYLSLWHGEELLEDIAADAEEAWRARIWLGAMALESLYDASRREGTDRPAAWRKLLRKVLPRIDRAGQAMGLHRSSA